MPFAEFDSGQIEQIGWNCHLNKLLASQAFVPYDCCFHLDRPLKTPAEQVFLKSFRQHDVSRRPSYKCGTTRLCFLPEIPAYRTKNYPTLAKTPKLGA